MLEQLIDLTESNDRDILLRIWQREFEASIKAAVQHERNYTGFMHLRKAFSLLSDFSTAELNLADYCLNKASFLESFCLQNPRDISGWSFLLFLIERSAQPERMADDSLKAVLDWAFKFKWDREGVWSFLATLLARVDLVAEDEFRTSIDRMQRFAENIESTVGVSDMTVADRTSHLPRAASFAVRRRSPQ